MGLSLYKKYGIAAGHMARAVKEGNIPHAYIIEGDSGFDKKGFAKAFFQAIVCRQMPGEGCGECAECRKIRDEIYEDMYVVSPEEPKSSKSGQGASTIKDADLEELQAHLKTKPTAGEHNFALIERGDTMTRRAQTRFLKTLEEPPEGTVIVILSENIEELIPTIRSRCVSERLYETDIKKLEIPPEVSGIVSMIKEKDYFYKITDALTAAVKTREDAYGFLDSVETLIGRSVRGVDGSVAPDAAMKAISEIEKIRKDIKLGASQKYMVRLLALRLEEII